jgi:hypothetical protein
VTILTDIPIDQYHASDALSKSKLSDLAECGPEYYHGRHVAKTIPSEETEALRLGRIFDGYIDDEKRERARWAEFPPSDLGNRPSDRAHRQMGRLSCAQPG